jgi:outer membrane receptor protein involved in Fe transport
MITAGVFYKNFLNPIEVVIDLNSTDPRNARYQNLSKAKSYGIEVEVKKSLLGLTGVRLVDNMSVMFNAALIRSQIINPNATTGQEKNRPMQGQAPFVVNAAVFYNNDDNGWQVNALYNIVGKNIVFVGNETFRTTYQMPRGVLDLTFSKRLGEKLQLRGGITDILNQPVQWMQDGNGNGKIERKKDLTTQKFRPGQVFSIGFSCRL